MHSPCIEVGRLALARHEEKLHRLTRGIVDENQQGARCAPILEPAVLAAVNLDQLAVCFTPQARMMKAFSLLTRQPQPILDHPSWQRLSRDLDSVLLEQNLRRQARAEIGIARPNQFDHIFADVRNKPVVRGAATSLVDQRTAPELRRTSGCEIDSVRTSFWESICYVSGNALSYPSNGPVLEE